MNYKPSILQWNLNGFRAQHEYLQLLMHVHNPAVICLQESNFSEEYMAPLKNYTGYNKNRTHAHRASGGVVTYIKDTIPHKVTPLHTQLEAVAVTIFITTAICICNVYFPNSVDIDITILTDLIRQLPHPFVILGDFNSHNILWGSNSTDHRGNTVESLIDSFGLILLNYPAPTHYNVAHNTFSSIDLSICSSNIAPLFQW